MQKDDTQQRDKSSLRVVTSLTLSLLIGATMALAAETGGERSQISGPSRAPGNASILPAQETGGGLRVFIDPKTGKLREPTREEEKALTHKGPRPKDAHPREIAGPGGAVGVMLDESFMTSMTVKKNPDGSLSFDCISGDQNTAAGVTEGKQSAKPVGKEDRHDR